MKIDFLSILLIGLPIAYLVWKFDEINNRLDNIEDEIADLQPPRVDWNPYMMEDEDEDEE
ncbi:MAG: hypothetical protein KJI70_00810 [Patescibacteria group bacterium]|nr:hypothetical protein [Patescibacteria group bacterium]